MDILACAPASGDGIQSKMWNKDECGDGIGVEVEVNMGGTTRSR